MTLTVFGAKRASPLKTAVTFVSRVMSTVALRFPAELTLPVLTSFFGLSLPCGSTQISTVRFLYVRPRCAVNLTSVP